MTMLISSNPIRASISCLSAVSRFFGRALVLLGAVTSLLLSGCGIAPYQPAPLDSIPLQARAETQKSGPIVVSAAVPGAEETETLFDLALYDSGIQPIWLQVDNNSGDLVRYAPVGTDPEYFSPLEIAYMNRGAFSKQGKLDMNRHFYEMAMPRRIPAGESRSGFVFTHARPGTKAFNVDLFGASRDDDLSFTFFIDVPGFQPDHSDLYFQELYTAEQIRDLDRDQLRSELARMGRQTWDRSGQQPGRPVNTAIIGEPLDALQALIRAGWIEKPRTDVEIAASKETMFGRIPDLIFTKNLSASGGRNELRIWLSPLRENGTPVWLAQVAHFIDEGKGRAQVDPDVDDAAFYFLQDIWYAQGLAGYGWVQGEDQVPFDDAKQIFDGSWYFTEGQLVVMWMSGPALSMLDVNVMDWDDGPVGEAL